VTTVVDETRRGRSRRRRRDPGDDTSTGGLRVVTTATRSMLPFWCIVAAVVSLCLIGLVFVLSASSVQAQHTYGSPWYFFLRQCGSLVIGAVACWIGYRVDHRIWVRWSRVVLIASVVCLALVLTPLGNEVNGAKRWLGPSFLGFQPSEIAKLAVVLWLAGLLSRRRQHMGEWRLTVVPALAVVGVVAGLVMAEPDLGTTVLVMVVAFTMLAVAGCRLDALALISLPVVALGGVASMWGFRRGRMLAFLDPWKHADNWGFQTLQSQVSLASGGLFGVGLGQSRAKWGFLPEAHTDFIFAIIGEELGLLGCTLVISLFLLLVVGGVTAARRARDLQSTLVAVGISTWIGLQALFNIGVAAGALPNKGITLPFVSYGGTSLIVTLFAAGILLNIARHPVAATLRAPRRPAATRRGRA
jgi:cell division protein FtsW